MNLKLAKCIRKRIRMIIGADVRDREYAVFRVHTRRGPWLEFKDGHKEKLWEAIQLRLKTGTDRAVYKEAKLHSGIWVGSFKREGIKKCLVRTQSS